jgi:molecular chaperone GrpE
MASEKKTRRWNRIPIKFLDSEQESDATQSDELSAMGDTDIDEDDSADLASGMEEGEADDPARQFSSPASVETPLKESSGELGGPALAELIATRSELKRVEAEVAELRDRLARRQADFENYRKRMDRERAETYNRVVADIAAKLLPVLDNLKRALETEASVEASESDEFRHFLSGVDLIYRQLEGLIDSLGVKPVSAVGEPFDPHLHEAVVTEPTDEYEPDIVIQEIVRGYRMGDKLIRPALVKVAVRNEDPDR